MILLVTGPRRWRSGQSDGISRSQIDIVRHNLQLADMTSTKQFVSGILGDGDGTIDLRTTNGDIEVRGY